MKIKILLLLLVIFAFTGCKTIKRQISEKKEPKFKVEMKSPKVSVGKVEAQLEGMFLRLKKVNVNVTYSPIEDAVCLEFKRNTITNYQFFSRENRAAFLKALENYTGDFDGHNLVSDKKTKFQYGNTEGYLIWKLTKISEQIRDSVEFSFGYLFKEKSPFFTITQGEVIYEDIFAQNSNDKYLTNGEFQLFFTRAQSMELAAFFDQQFLNGLTKIRPDSIDENINYESY
jgi:hypothetical protein